MSNDAHEPWYQIVPVRYDEVKSYIINDIKFTNEFKLDTDESLKQLNDIIDAVVDEKNDFGSLRGYCTFLHAGYVKAVKKKLLDKQD